MKKLLIVVDYQNDFVNGSLGFPDAYKLDEKICKLIEESDDVIFTLDTHDEKYMETMEGKKLPVPHCIKGSEGHKIYGKTASYINKAKAIFEKPTFPSLELANYLRENPYDEVYLVGLVTNICIISNAVMVKAALPNAKIVVLKDYVDTYDKEAGDIALKALSSLHIEVK